MYRLLSMPLRESSTHVIFIPTDIPEKRIHMLRSVKELETLPEDSSNIFQTNIIDRYMARPASLQNVCLADFASQYVVRSRDTEEDEHSEEDQNNLTSKTITLTGSLGKMHKRKKPAIIRFHKNSKQKDPEGHYHRILMLYYPWIHENDLMLNGSYENKFEELKNELKSKIDEYEHNIEQLNEIQENSESEYQHAWDSLAAECEQEKADELENQHIDQEELMLQPEDNIDPPEFADSKSTYKNFSADFSNDHLPFEEYSRLVCSLNEKQRLLHDFIADWCWQLKMQKLTKTEVYPFYIFLSGGGGVGKSHALTTAYHAAINALLDVGQDPSDVCAVLTAPTGTAAFNIGGMTIHSTLHLPVRQVKTSEDDYLPLSCEIKNTLKCKFQNLKLLIIDEISMVGSKTLINIHRRLQEIKGNRSDSIPFGGVSILAVGDLMQLPPVGDSAVFSSPNDPMQRLNMTIWEQYFKLLELTEVQRQRGDPDFADMLNRIRMGNHTKRDVDILKGQVKPNSLPERCLSIYPTNQQVDTHNHMCMDALTEKVVEIKAEDNKPKCKSSSLTLPSNRHQTGGLHEILKLAVGAQVSVVKNIDVTDGLVNGATGTVVHIEINQKYPMKGTIFVSFLNPKIGKKAKETVMPKFKRFKACPITPVTARFNVGNSKTLFVERTQFPLTLAWSATVHKVQGQTLDQVIVSFEGGRFTAGQAYVALSRSKSLSGLYLQNFDPDKIKVNKSALAEMKRLQDHSLFTWKPPLQHTRKEGSIVIAHLNIRSFSAHKSDFMADKVLQSTDVIALSETYLTNETAKDLSIDSFSFFHRSTKHGVGAFVRKNLLPQQLSLDTNLETLPVQINVHNKKTTLIICYKPPKLPLFIFENSLVNLLKSLPEQPVILLGDFNSDILQKSSLPSRLSELAFIQNISKPTHKFGGLLDHIYSKNLKPCDTGTSYCYYSDHSVIYATF